MLRGPLNALEHILMIYDPCTNLLTFTIDLIKLINVVLVGTECLVVYFFDTAFRAQCGLGVWQLGLV